MSAEGVAPWDTAIVDTARPHAPAARAMAIFRVRVRPLAAPMSGVCIFLGNPSPFSQLIIEEIHNLFPRKMQPLTRRLFDWKSIT